jgi:uridine phosphorylase
MLELLNFDDSPHAVIDPFRDEGYVFPERMLFAFVDATRIDEFCRAHHGRVLATFETISNVFHVQQVIVDGEPVGICRAPLGAPAATQLLEFLIAYGARRIIATGSCGVLNDQAENEFLVVQRALRDEGTSFHYLPAADSITLDADFAMQVKATIESQGNAAKFVNTWTTDAFFRETAAKGHRKTPGWLHRRRNGMRGTSSMCPIPAGTVRPNSVYGRFPCGSAWSRCS